MSASIQASIIINFDLSKPIEFQFHQFDKIKVELENRGITLKSSTRISNQSSTVEMGPNEKAWLSFSGRSRMNMKDKTLSREQQAIVYLKEKGQPIFDIPETIQVEISEDESHDDDSDVLS